MVEDGRSGDVTSPRSPRNITARAHRATTGRDGGRSPSPKRAASAHSKSKALQAHRRRAQLLLALAGAAWVFASSGAILVNKAIMVDLKWVLAVWLKSSVGQLLLWARGSAASRVPVGSVREQCEPPEGTDSGAASE